VPRALPIKAAKPAKSGGAAKDGDVPGETGPYRNVLCDELQSTFRGASDLRQLFENVVERFGSNPAQGWREVEVCIAEFANVAHGAKHTLCLQRKIKQEVTFTNREGEKVTRETEKWVMAPQYKWRTYNDMRELVVAIGAGIWAKLPEGGAEGDDEGDGSPARRIGIFAETKPEWMQIAQGAFRHGIPITTVYATLGADAVAYAITQTSLSVMFVDGDLMPVLASCKAGREVPTGDGDETFTAHCSSLQTVVWLGPEAELNTQAADQLRDAGVEVLSLAALREVGRDAPVPDNRDTMPTPDSIANIQYTSGSTGLPKGVIIHHRNLVAASAGMGNSIPDVDENDCYMAYLPLAHILELAAELNLICRGASVGYASKDTLVASSQRIPVADPAKGVPVVKGDAAVLQPTVMAAVPAIMEKIRRGISAKVAAKGAVTKLLFDTAFKAKQTALAAGRDTPFWNFLLFDKIRTEALGGRVRAMLSGGGPLNTETQQFMNVVFCCPVGQGYGLTESMGAGTIVHFADRAMGTVGPPVLSVDIKLEDWAEGGYSTAKNPPRGEVCITGPIVASGYWMLPEKTASDFKRDSETGAVWFHTGDIGEFTPEGVLRIIDRKKDLVKLTTGEYISLGKIESTMKLCNWITNLMAYGDGDAPHAVAIVTLDVDAVRKEIPDAGDSVEEQAQSDKVKKLVLDDLKRIAKEKHFPKMETPQNIAIATEEWTPESGLVTASLKLKRKALMDKYKEDLVKLYKGR